MALKNFTGENLHRTFGGDAGIDYRDVLDALTDKALNQATSGVPGSHLVAGYHSSCLLQLPIEPYRTICPSIATMALVATGSLRPLNNSSVTGTNSHQSGI